MSYSHAVLFVCLGNICRSPAGAALLNARIQKDPQLQDRVMGDSCGLGSWYVGHTPDQRMQRQALARGVSLTGRARQFTSSCFSDYDLILPVDRSIQYSLYERAKSPQEKSKIHLATEFSGSFPKEDIPDPFFESDAAFDLALDMLEDVCDGLIHFMHQKWA